MAKRILGEQQYKHCPHGAVGAEYCWVSCQKAADCADYYEG